MNHLETLARGKGVNYFLSAYSFDYKGNLEELQKGLNDKTQRVWNLRENAFTGNYVTNASDQGITRVFEDHTVDIRLDHPKGSFQDWKQTAVTPILDVLKTLGANNFQVDTGNY